VAYIVGLVIALCAFWLGLSGHYTPLILSLGAVSIVISVLLTARLTGIDRDSSPYFKIFGIIAYFPWLMWEIIKANYTVIRACLRADLDIAPALVKVKTTCRSDYAKVLFANSITLTPGTVTVDVDGDKLLVHALYEDGAGPEAFVEMDRRSKMAVDHGGDET